MGLFGYEAFAVEAIGFITYPRADPTSFPQCGAFEFDVDKKICTLWSDPGEGAPTAPCYKRKAKTGACESNVATTAYGTSHSVFPEQLKYLRASGRYIHEFKQYFKSEDDSQECKGNQRFSVLV